MIKKCQHEFLSEYVVLSSAIRKLESVINMNAGLILKRKSTKPLKMVMISYQVHPYDHAYRPIN